MTKKIKVEMTIDVTQFCNIKPQFEIDVPEDIENEELITFLFNKYYKMFEIKK